MAAHKAAATAEHVAQLAARVPTTSEKLRVLCAKIEPSHQEGPVVVAARERITRTSEIKEHALGVVFSQSDKKSDEELGETQQRLDAHLVQLEVMKEAVSGELESLARQIDGAEREAALAREQQRLTESRVSTEVGQCNKLIFVLGQMLSSLEDIKEGLFDSRRSSLGRDPEWHEIGALVGSPTAGPEFIVGEYAFLMQDDDPIEQTPEILGRIYHAEANFRQVLARLEQRSRLWDDFNELRAAGTFTRGEEAVQQLGSSAALVARLKELTAWLKDEWIPKFKSLFPEIYRVLSARYPGRRFIRFWPKDNPNSPSP